MNKLDRMLGRGVVTVGTDGFLTLNEPVLLAQLHRSPRPGSGVRCYCLMCKAGRDRKPVLAALPVEQPWEPRPPRLTALQ